MSYLEVEIKVHNLFLLPDINVANKWATKDGMRIVEIDLNKLPKGTNIYDLSTDIGRSTYLKGATAKGLAKGSSEVLIEGYIPANALKVIRREIE